MTFYEVRDKIIKGININDIPLRVTFYARVSTESDEQLNSLENQKIYFENYINSNEIWTYITGYIDEGISGSTVNNRKEFLRMIKDSKDNKFDLIMTKEVSRFSRNLLDSIKYTQELMHNNVGVLFQTNGINTYDPNSEFILNMMGSVAQEEVKRLSMRVKWGHNNAIKRGRILGSIITGYNKKNCRLIVNEDEAYKICQIFKLYATNKYGLNKLAKILYEEGITNSLGNIYDKDTLKRIIENPKYKGYYCGHTTEVIDYRTKKRIKINREDQIIYKDKNIPPIVSTNLWDRANNILKVRSILIKRNHGNAKKMIEHNSYTGKIICKNHSCNYQKINSKNIKWACKEYIRYGINSCESPIILENNLDLILKKAFLTIFNDKEAIINSFIKYYVSNDKKNNTIIALEKKIKNYQYKKECLLELKINNIIDNEDYQNKNLLYNKKLKCLNNDLILEKDNMKHYINRDINDIKKELYNLLDFNTILKDMVSTYLDKIIVSKINNKRNNLILDIYMNLNLIKRKKYFFESKKTKYSINIISLGSDI